MVTVCGIAGIFLRDPNFTVDLDGILDTLLLEIENRGEHATGYVAIGDEGKLEWQKAACKASIFVKYRRLVPDGTRAILAHTRWATQGLPGFMENNHPIRRGPFFIIHNGHVNNDEVMFRDSERLRYGEVDSEAIAAKLSHLGDLDRLGEVIELIDGDAAVAAVDERHGNRLVVARGHSSPLYIYNGRRIVLFGSTMAAVQKAYEKHIGKMGKARLIYANEGEMFSWTGPAGYVCRKLTLPKREIRWTREFEWKDYDWTDYDKKYGTNNGRAIKPVGAIGPGKLSKSEQETLMDWDDDEEELDCDNCGSHVTWKNIRYFHDYKDDVTYILCDDCFDYYGDGADAEIIEGDWQELTDDELDPYTREELDAQIIDDYDKANNSIINMLKHTLRGI